MEPQIYCSSGFVTDLFTRQKEDKHMEEQWDPAVEDESPSVAEGQLATGHEKLPS